jgi:D-alanyl-D-alanine carboxypeptidase/D-alanyl-D-alanine-endopeptidase (penicillin-binding protein 4)
VLHFFKMRRFLILFLLLLFLLSGTCAVWAVVNTHDLQSVWQKPGLSASHTGIQVISLKSGKSVFTHNANLALMPASNMKLITSAAALSLLKPEFTFKTLILSDGPIRGGVLKGNLYLKGLGDPDLTDERLAQLASDIRYLGVQRIEGRLFADDSYFDAQRQGEGWKNSYGASAYSAHISALSLNRNTVDVWIRPGAPGQPAEVALDPPNHYFEVLNQTQTGGRTRLQIARTMNGRGRNLVTVSGSVAAHSRPEKESINLENPALYAGFVFQNLLQKAGVAVSGPVEAKKVPAGALEIARTESRPLRDIVGELNKHSVNLIAENLLKYMGAVFEGEPGTAAKGAQVIHERFLKQKVQVDSLKANIRIADGSGLSPLNRLSADVLTRVLIYMQGQFDVGVDYVSSLAISGVDGTLHARLNSADLKRRIRAKTGFINSASSLSGYVYTQKNETLAFSFLMNHFTGVYAARSSQDSLCQQLIHWAAPQ